MGAKWRGVKMLNNTRAGSGERGAGKAVSQAGKWLQTRAKPSRLSGLMDKYRSLVAWQRAHALVLLVLRTVDARYHPRSRALFDQLKRAAISVEANIVEGYALSTRMNFRRHLRIALGSAAETESLVRIADEVEYLSREEAAEILKLVGGVIGTLFGLLRNMT